MNKWKLVPVEPTLEMVKSGEFAGDVEMYIGDDAAEYTYKAMLEAAPQPPKLSDERILELMGFRDQDFPMKGDKQYRLCIGSLWQRRAIEIARAVEREILGVTNESN